jgi:hypothetical protein
MVSASMRTSARRPSALLDERDASMARSASRTAHRECGGRRPATAKRKLGWQPRYPSLRECFVELRGTQER